MEHIIVFDLLPKNIIKAIKTNKLRRLNKLLQKCSNFLATTSFGDNLLHLACEAMTSKKIFDCVLKYLPASSLQYLQSQANQQGLKPLHVAVLHPDRRIVLSLIRKKVQVDILDARSYSPLHFAVKQSTLAMIKALIKAGSNLLALNEAGDRPLHRALGFKNETAAIYLMEQEWKQWKLIVSIKAYEQTWYVAWKKALSNLLQPEIELSLAVQEWQSITYNWLKELHPEKDTALIGYLLIQLSDQFLVLAEMALPTSFKIFENCIQAMMFAVAAERFLQTQGHTEFAKVAIVQQQRILRKFLIYTLRCEDVIKIETAFSAMTALRKSLQEQRKNIRILLEDKISASVLVSTYSEFLSTFMIQLWQESLAVVERQKAKPCNYALLGLGSLARQEASLYSDIESALVLEGNTETICQYYTLVAQIWWLRIIQLGETSFALPLAPGEYYFTKAGLCMDNGGNNPISIQEVCLMGTPHDLAIYQTDRYFEEQTIASNSLKTVTFLAGSETLYHQYEVAKQAYLRIKIIADGGKRERCKIQALKLLAGHLEEFAPKLDEDKINLRHFDVKKELYRLPTMVIESLSLYCNVASKNTQARVMDLVKQKILHLDIAKRLITLLENAFRWRILTHLFYGYEYHKVWHPSQEQQALALSGEKTYVLTEKELVELAECYQTLLPLHAATEKFVEARGKTTIFQKQIVATNINDWLNQSEAYRRLGDYDKAEQYCQRALALKTTDLSFWLKLINIEHERYQQLQAEYHNVVEAQKNTIYFIFYKLLKNQGLPETGLPFFNILPDHCQAIWKKLLIQYGQNDEVCAQQLQVLAQHDLDAGSHQLEDWLEQILMLPTAIKESCQAAAKVLVQAFTMPRLTHVQSKEAHLQNLFSLLKTMQIHVQTFLVAEEQVPEQFLPVVKVFWFKATQNLILVYTTLFQSLKEQLTYQINHLVEELIVQKQTIKVWLTYYQQLSPYLRQEFRTVVISYLDKLNTMNSNNTLSGFHSSTQLETILSQLNNYPDETGVRVEWEAHQQSWRQQLQMFIEAEFLPEANLSVLLHSFLLPSPGYLKSDLVSALLNEDGNFISHQIHYSRHNVIRVEVGGRSYYIKAYPEMPGMTYLIEQLHGRLIGHGVSRSELAKLEVFSSDKNKRKRNITNIPILISEEVLGESLLSVICSHPEQLNQLNLRRLQELMLVAILTNPEDGKPDNYQMVPLNKAIVLGNNEQEYALISVDHDHAMFPSWTLQINADGSKEAKLHVKTILFCLSQMDSALNPSALEAFLAIQPDKLLRRWLWDAQQQNQAYQSLFSQEELLMFHHTSDEKSTIPIPIKKGDVTKLYLKLTKLQAFLRLHPKATIMQLLLQVEPRAGLQYLQARLAYPNDLLACFQSVGQYPVADDGSLITSTQALQTLRLQTFLVAQNEYMQFIDLDPAQGIAELDLIAYQQKQLDAIRQEVEKGELARYRTLVTFHETIINGDKSRSALDFSKIDADKHDEIVIRALQYPLQILHLAHAKLSQSVWDRIYEAQGQHLIELDMSRQAEWANQLLKKHLKNFPILKRLQLANLKGMILDLNDIFFSQLEELNLNENKYLNKIFLIAPKLKILRVEKCKRLRSIYLPESDIEILKAEASLLEQKIINFPFLLKYPVDVQNETIALADNSSLTWLKIQSKNSDWKIEDIKFLVTWLKVEKIANQILDNSFSKVANLHGNIKLITMEALSGYVDIMFLQSLEMQNKIIEIIFNALDDSSMHIRLAAIQAVNHYSDILFLKSSRYYTQDILQRLIIFNAKNKKDFYAFQTALLEFLKPEISNKELQILLHILKLLLGSDVNIIKESVSLIGKFFVNIFYTFLEQTSKQAEVLSVLVRELVTLDSNILNFSGERYQFEEYYQLFPLQILGLGGQALKTLLERIKYMRQEVQLKLIQLIDDDIQLLFLYDIQISHSFLIFMMENLENSDMEIYLKSVLILETFISLTFFDSVGMNEKIFKCLISLLKFSDKVIKNGVVKLLGHCIDSLCDFTVKQLNEILNCLVEIAENSNQELQGNIELALRCCVKQLLQAEDDKQYTSQANENFELMKNLLWSKDAIYIHICEYDINTTSLYVKMILPREKKLIPLFLNEIIKILDMSKSNSQTHAVRVLGHCINFLPEQNPILLLQIIDKLIALLGNNDNQVRKYTKVALKQCGEYFLQRDTSLSQKLLARLGKGIFSIDYNIARATIKMIGQLACFMPPYLHEFQLIRKNLVEILRKDFDIKIREAALITLKQFSNLLAYENLDIKQMVIERLLEVLSGANLALKKYAIQALGQYISTWLPSSPDLYLKVVKELTELVFDFDVPADNITIFSQVYVELAKTKIVQAYKTWEKSSILASAENKFILQSLQVETVTSNKHKLAEQARPKVSQQIMFSSLFKADLNDVNQSEGKNSFEVEMQNNVKNITHKLS